MNSSTTAAMPEEEVDTLMQMVRVHAVLDVLARTHERVPAPLSARGPSTSRTLAHVQVADEHGLKMAENFSATAPGAVAQQDGATTAQPVAAAADAGGGTVGGGGGATRGTSLEDDLEERLRRLRS